MALLIKNGNLVLEDGVRTADLRCDGGVIGTIGENLVPEAGDEVMDASGMYVMPGVIDSHVHYKMAIGNVCTVDNFETGSRSAACGGVTTVVDYADPLPGKSLVESLDYRRHEARRAFVDHTFHMVITPESGWTREDLKALKEYGVNSLKLFTTYGDMLAYDQMEEIIGLAGELGLVVTIHAEDNQIVADQVAALKAEGKTQPAYHGVSRPASAEVEAVKKLVEISKKVDAGIHIVHVSAGETGEVIRKAREEGVKITAETCPHYLELDDSVYQWKNAQLFVMQPPLRKPEDRRLLWENVQKGTFDFFTTDHCAYSEAQKFSHDTFFETNGGIPGSETLLPVLFSEGVSKGRISVEQLSRMLSENPARLFGLFPRKGVLRPGSDADLVIVDPEKQVTLDKDLLHSAADYSTFEGMTLTGYPVCTVLRGRILFRDGHFLPGDPFGRFVPISHEGDH